MKIRCDVCEKEEATVFCSADEAALCRHCDRRVHHANKLAGEHHRFALLHPSFKDSPRCDICQERRAFLFCQEDRAILCKECDNSIHKANEHTQKHNRFLLSGVKLLPAEASSSYPTSTSSNGSNNFYNAGTSESESEIRNKSSSISQEIFRPISTHDRQKALETKSTPCHGFMSQEYGIPSSISEYLMETLPGWHVEDFLDPSSSP